MKATVAEWLEIIYGMRKFLIMLMLYATAIAFRVFEWIDGQQFVELLKTTTLAFMAANGTEHAAKIMKIFKRPQANNEQAREKV